MMGRLRLVIELIKGVAWLLALSLLQRTNSRFWRDRKTAGKVFSGVLFGVICVVGMTNPIVLTPGVIFDARSVVLSMAGLSGGLLVAGVAAIIAGAYRLWLGGPGVEVGLTVVLSCVTLGLLYRHAVVRGWAQVGVWQLLVFGFVVHLFVVLFFTQLPAGIAPQVLASVSLPLLLTFTPATLVLGLLLQVKVNRAETK